MMKLSRMIAAVAVLLLSTYAAQAAVWTNTTSTTTPVNNILWSVDSNWDTNPSPYPNGVGVVATIDNAQTANRLIDFGDNLSITVGTLNLKNESAFFTQLGTIARGVTLTFDNTGTTDAVFNISGHATTTSANSNSIRVNIVLNDNLHLTTDYEGGATAPNTFDYSKNAINFLSGDLSGTGGIIKDGIGAASFSDVPKTLTGPIVINQGRLRNNNLSSFPNAASMTIASGGQYTTDKNGFITIGNPNTAVITLNGLGTVQPPAGFGFWFPGAIRTGSGLTNTIENKINLASDASIVVISTNQTTGLGSLFLTNEIYGPGKFIAGSKPNQISREGTIILTAHNTYTGGTKVEQGTLELFYNASPAADGNLGSGDVYIEGNLPSFDGNVDGASSGKLKIDTGVTNAIADTATLTLTGDGGQTGSVAGCDRGCAILGASVNEIVGGLVLNGVAQGAGTYGATGSGATNIFDEYFGGSGMVTVVPPTVAGDFNGDGKVNAADYPTWRKSDGTTGGYATWRENFSQTSASSQGLGQAAAVPEPGTLALLTVLLSLAFVGRRR